MVGGAAGADDVVGLAVPAVAPPLGARPPAAGGAAAGGFALGAAGLAEVADGPVLAGWPGSKPSIEAIICGASFSMPRAQMPTPARRLRCRQGRLVEPVLAFVVRLVPLAPDDVARPRRPGDRIPVLRTVALRLGVGDVCGRSRRVGRHGPVGRGPVDAEEGQTDNDLRRRHGPGVLLEGGQGAERPLVSGEAALGEPARFSS